MTDEELLGMAKTIYAEGSVFVGRNEDALLGIAQTIRDLMDFTGWPLEDVLEKCFTEAPNTINMACLEVAKSSEKRFPDDQLLQFRSFYNYAKNGTLDYSKAATILDNYTYLGSDSISDDWGHLYFGHRGGKNMKVLLIAGHGRNPDGTYDPGAIGCGYREADLTREFTQIIARRLRARGVETDVAPDRNYYTYLRSGGEFDFIPYTYVLEIHFNASTETDYKGDGKPRGTMFYISKSEKGHSVEDKILKNFIAVGSCKAWDGVVVAQRQWPKGLLVQEKVRAQGVSHAVLETMFVSDKDDMDLYQANKEDFGDAVAKGIVEGFGQPKPIDRRVVAPYEVEILVDSLNVRSGPGMDYGIVTTVKKPYRYHIIAESGHWGQLQSKAGWISILDNYVKRV